MLIAQYLAGLLIRIQIAQQRQERKKKQIFNGSLGQVIFFQSCLHDRILHGAENQLDILRVYCGPSRRLQS